MRVGEDSKKSKVAHIESECGETGVKKRGIFD